MEATMETSIWALLTDYVVRLPLFLVWVVTALAAITRWRMLPKQAVLVLAAVAVLAADTLVGLYLSRHLPVWVVLRWGSDYYAVASQVLAFGRSSVQAVAWALVAYAALGRIVRPFEKG